MNMKNIVYIVSTILSVVSKLACAAPYDNFVPVANKCIPGKFLDLSSNPKDLPSAGNSAKVRWSVNLAGIFRNDFIIFPGIDHVGHIHYMWGIGNTAEMTPESIANEDCSFHFGGTFIKDKVWAPAFIKSDGSYVTPVSKSPSPQIQKLGRALLYLADGAATPDKSYLHVPPNGLELIAGSASNLNYDDYISKTKQITFSCYDANGSIDASPKVTSSTFLPDCPVGSLLTTKVLFPSCLQVDAKGNPVLKSKDHYSHVAYDKTGDWKPNRLTTNCPVTHPYKIPSYVLFYFVPVTIEHETLTWRLDSDMLGAKQAASKHADVVVEQEDSISRMEMLYCLKDNPADCGTNAINGLILKDPNLLGE